MPAAKGRAVARARGRAEPAGRPSDVRDLDRLIHERARLGIVTALAGVASLTFAELREVVGLTDGNLAVHGRRLEEAGYVAVSKGFDGRVPRTEYRLTADGRAALRRYLDHMEAVIRAARPA